MTQKVISKIPGGLNPTYLMDYSLREELKSNSEYNWVKEDKKYKYLSKVLEQKSKDPELENAIQIFLDKQKRTIVNSFILAGALSQDISLSLELDLGIIEKYIEYCFQKEVLKSKLDKLAYVKSVSNKDEKESYLYALTFGVDFVKWRICGEAVPVHNLRTDLRELFSVAKYNAQVASMNPITGEQSKEALKWMAQAAKLSDILAKHDQNSLDNSDPSGNEGIQSSVVQELFGVIYKVKSSNDIGSVNDIDEDEIG